MNHRTLFRGSIKVNAQNSSSQCDKHYRKKQEARSMKTILALALLGATVLLVGGEEFSAEHAEFFDAVEDPHRHHRPSGHPRPSGRPRPTPPEFVRQCAAKAKECVQNAGDDACKKLACAKEFGECLKANKPDNFPTAMPPRVKICVAMTKKCAEAAGDDCGKKLMCLKRLGMCLRRRPHRPRPTPPEFVRQCAEKGKECVQNAGDDACKKLACAKAFGECLKANKPDNFPTAVPPRVKFCVALVKKCAAAAGDDCGKKLMCLKRLGICLHRRRPGRGDSAEEDEEFQVEHAELVDIL